MAFLTRLFSSAPPPVLSAADAEQWLFRHDQYLEQHGNRDLNVGRYYPDLARATPEAQRRAIMNTFQEALAQSWLAYQNSEWSIDLADRNPRIDINEVFPALANASSSDLRKKAVAGWLRTQGERRAAAEEQAKAQSEGLSARAVTVHSPAPTATVMSGAPRTVHSAPQSSVSSAPVPFVPHPSASSHEAAEEREKVAAEADDGDDYDVVDPSEVPRYEPVSDFPPVAVVASPVPVRVQAESEVRDQPPTQASLYPALPSAPFVYADPYLPRTPFVCCVHPNTPIEIGQFAVEAPPARSGLMSFLSRRPVGVQVPRVDTSAIERRFTADFTGKKANQAIRDYVAAMNGKVSADWTLKQKIAFFGQAVEKALRNQRARTRETEIRSRFCMIIIDELAVALRTALLNPDQNAIPVINAFLQIKADLVRLRKTGFMGETPERLLVRLALFGDERPSLVSCSMPMQRLNDAFYSLQARASSPTDAAMLKSYRLKWSQWTWALQQLQIMTLPADLFRSETPLTVLRAMSLASGSQEPPPPSAPSPEPGDLPASQVSLQQERPEARPKRRAEHAAPTVAVTVSAPEDEEPVEAPTVSPGLIGSYIDVQFAGIEANGEMIKRVASIGKYYRLLKLALLERRPNPWSLALWDFEVRRNAKFSALATIDKLERRYVLPLLKSYKDQKLIKSLFAVVHAIEAGSSPEDLQAVIAKVPDQFFVTQKFLAYVVRQAEAEGVEIDFQAQGWMDSLAHTPIIAQAIMAWFDNRITAYVNHLSNH